MVFQTGLELLTHARYRDLIKKIKILRSML